MAGFIVGFDNESTRIFERQIRFHRKSAIPSRWWIAQRLPETPLGKD